LNLSAPKNSVAAIRSNDAPRAAETFMQSSLPSLAPAPRHRRQHRLHRSWARATTITAALMGNDGATISTERIAHDEAAGLRAKVKPAAGAGGCGKNPEQRLRGG
jgi:hypothetical protein